MAATIKAGTNTWLRVIFKGIDDFDLVEAIEFMFKQDEDDDEGAVLKTAFWSASGTSRDAEKEENDEEDVILVKWRKEETYLFEQGENLYLDTRIHFNGTWDNPETNIVRLRMSNTLFESGEEATVNG